MLIILLGVAARCYRITEPLMDRYAWRQYDTAAVARNFYQGPMNLLYPQVDWRGDSTGYVEAEFPLYSYIVAALYHVFGVHEWLGRAVNICFYALTALLLFQFARRLLDEEAAVFAVLFYSFTPLSFVFTRTFQPDALMTMAAFAGVYWFWRWIEEQRGGWLMISGLAIIVASLIKPTILFIGLPMLYLCWQKFRWKWLANLSLWVFGIAILGLGVLWYLHGNAIWNEHGSSFYRQYFERGNPGPFDPFWFWQVMVVGQRVLLLILTIPGALLAVLGCVFALPRQPHFLRWWLVGFTISLALAAHGYRDHHYYLLPVTPMFALLMAHGLRSLRGIAFLPARWHRPAVVTLSVAILASSFWLIPRQTNVSANDLRRIRFGEVVKQVAGSDSRFIWCQPRAAKFIKEHYQHRTPAGERLPADPVDFYLSGTKGWNIDEVQATPEFLEALRKRGAQYFATSYPQILDRQPQLAATLENSYHRVLRTPEGALFKLDTPRESNRRSPERTTEQK